MAYVPPHKRHSKDSPKPTPIPSSMISQFRQSLTVGESSSGRRQDRRSSSNQRGYKPYSISRWFAAGSAGDDPIPPTARLEPFDCEVFERKNGAKPMVLKGGEGGEIDNGVWVKIAERFVPDLIDCYQSVSEGSESEKETMKLSVIARMGKVLFLGNSIDLETIRKLADSGTYSRKQFSEAFYTIVSSDYMEQIQHLVLPKIGFDFDSEREHYRVKVFDKSQTSLTISCKCKVSSDGKGLEIHKVELNPVRHLVWDISCLYKDLDLRLMLVTKRINKYLNEEENEGINRLIKSAIIDPDVEGGLRWPLGEESVADRFRVFESWHSTYKTFRNQTTKMKLRRADRFNHLTSIGEVFFEVSLKMTTVSKHLRDGNAERGLVKEMVQESVKLIWDNLLN